MKRLQVLLYIDIFSKMNLEGKKKLLILISDSKVILVRDT